MAYEVKTYVVQKVDEEGRLGAVIAVKLSFDGSSTVQIRLWESRSNLTPCTP